MRRKGEPAAPGADRENAVLVGRLLRGHRENRGLAPGDVAQAIKVSERHVIALEEGRLAALPQQPYGRGLIRAYALLLGLDPQELLRVCGPELSGEGSATWTGIFPRPDGQRFRWREWAVPLTLAAAVVAFEIARTLFSPPPLDRSTGAAVTAAVARPIEQLVARATGSAAPVQPVEAPLAAPGVRVTLRCEGATWVEATTDGGETRRYELGPGQNLALEARESLRLALGDAGVIRLRSNERELGFIGYKGESKSGLLFTAAKGTVALAPRQAAGD